MEMRVSAIENQLRELNGRIEELGLSSLGEEQQKHNLANYYDTLEIRTSIALEEKLSDAQLGEFERLQEAGDDDAVMAWLRQAVPDYDTVVADEAESLKQDIKRTAAILRQAVNE